MALTPNPKTVENDTPVVLRGTQRGLEVEIHPDQEAEAIARGLKDKLSESPGFWAGSNVILRFLGEVVIGSLGPLESVCSEFDLKIVGIHSPLEERNKTARQALAVVNELDGLLAEGSAPVPVMKPPRLIPKDEVTGPHLVEAIESAAVEVESAAVEVESAAVEVESAAVEVESAVEAESAAVEVESAVEAEAAVEVESAVEAEAVVEAVVDGPDSVEIEIDEVDFALATEAVDVAADHDRDRRFEIPGNWGRFVRGPIRSGVILESEEHLVILGDVNPGAEVRSLGGITVLGRLRGVAHAGAGTADGASGFILALELLPQQLRLGELVARAGDADHPPGRAEIAFARDGQIIVETFRGALPRQLWSLLSE